jgi:hypothetical protein
MRLRALVESGASPCSAALAEKKQPRMAGWMTQGPLALALGLIGLFPKQCWQPGPGGGSGGDGGQGGSSVGGGTTSCDGSRSDSGTGRLQLTASRS